jgi:hypothetical protein
MVKIFNRIDVSARTLEKIVSVGGIIRKTTGNSYFLIGQPDSELTGVYLHKTGEDKLSGIDFDLASEFLR